MLLTQLTTLAALCCTLTNAANPLAQVKNVKMTAKPALDRTSLVKVDSYEDALLLKNFKSRDNIIFCEETGTLIMHSSKLDTSARTGGTIFSGTSNTKENKVNWYEFKGGDHTTVPGPRLPLTGCLNNQHGDGGSISGSFSKNFGKTSSLDLSYGIDFGGNFQGSLDYALSVGTSISVSASYSCTIPGKTTGQMFISPFFVEIDNGQYRVLKVKKRRSWKKPLVKKPKDVEVGGWKAANKVRVSSLGTKPIFSCVTDPRYLACDANIIGDTWSFN